MQDIQYELISCFEFLAIRGTINRWKENCLDQLGLPKELFLNCFNMGNGTQVFSITFILWLANTMQQSNGKIVLFHDSVWSSH